MFLKTVWLKYFGFGQSTLVQYWEVFIRLEQFQDLLRKYKELPFNQQIERGCSMKFKMVHIAIYNK